jgi:hypothetical protein
MPQLWNRVVDSMTRHEQQLRLGKGKQPKPFGIDKNIIKCKNNVGTNLTRGSVVDVGNYLLTGLSSYEPATLWFNGDEPAGGHYAVFRGAVPDGEYGDAQLTGVCIARVNVTDEDHPRAIPTIGETYFTSAWEGPVEILDRITEGTGVKECIVILRRGVRQWRGITLDAITHGTFGTVKLVKWNGTDDYESITGDSADITVEAGGYLLNDGETIEVDTAVILSMMDDGTFEVANSNCAVRDWDLADEAEE